MNDIVSKLREENEVIKELFDFNGCTTQIKHLKEVFTNFINNSNNCSYYFLQLLEYYSKFRPHQHNISKELTECIYSCFPEQINEIQQNIKENTKILKFIIFPEEFPMNESKERNEMFSLLQRDDIDGFISFLSNNPTIDIVVICQSEN